MAGKELVVVRPRGRPTLYSEEIAEYILDQLSLGRTLQSICADDVAGLPKAMTVSRWADTVPGFNEDYARARQLQVEAWKQEARDAANTPLIGDEVIVAEEELVGADGQGYTKRMTRRERRDMLGHRRLQSDVLIKLIGAVQQAENTRITVRKMALEGADDSTPRRIIVETNMPPDEED